MGDEGATGRQSPNEEAAQEEEIVAATLAATVDAPEAVEIDLQKTESAIEHTNELKRYESMMIGPSHAPGVQRQQTGVFPEDIPSPPEAKKSKRPATTWFDPASMQVALIPPSEDPDEPKKVKPPPPAINGHLIVLGACVGINAKAVMREMVRQHPNKFGIVVSHTSRPPKASEVDGVDYHFISHDAFDAKKEAGFFLTTTKLGDGTLMGVTLDSINEVCNRKLCALLRMNVNGMKSMKRLGAVACYAFIRPISYKHVESELVKKYPEENPKWIKNAVEDAAVEQAYTERNAFFQCTIIHQDHEETVAEFERFALVCTQLPPGQAPKKQLHSVLKGGKHYKPENKLTIPDHPHQITYYKLTCIAMEHKYTSYEKIVYKTEWFNETETPLDVRKARGDDVTKPDCEEVARPLPPVNYNKMKKKEADRKAKEAKNPSQPKMDSKTLQNMAAAGVFDVPPKKKCLML